MRKTWLPTLRPWQRLWNNVGPGLGLVGPAGNFSGFSNLSKLVLSFDMLAGRLELIPMLMIFVPSVWSVKRKKK